MGTSKAHSGLDRIEVDYPNGLCVFRSWRRPNSGGGDAGTDHRPGSRGLRIGRRERERSTLTLPPTRKRLPLHSLSNECARSVV